MSRNLPDFLIVGAAKSGTTSLYRYLRSHPGVFLPWQKEPRFFVSGAVAGFTDEDPRSTWVKGDTVKDLEAYRALFDAAQPGQRIGEASTAYLYYHAEAIPRIRALIPHASIIMILRNPVDRAFSAYTQLLRDESEQRSFEASLELEAERVRQRWTNLYYYVDQGLYADQVAAYQARFERVKVVLHDDLAMDSPGVVADLCRFLGVDPDHRPDTGSRFNVSGVPRNRFLYRFLARDNALKSALRPLVQRLLPQQFTDRQVARLTAGLMSKPEMTAATRSALQERFKTDILRLQDLIGRDLSGWLS